MKDGKETKRFYSEILENMEEGVVLVRMNDAIIFYTNPKFELMFGYGPGELIGKNISLVNAPTEKTAEETAEEIMGIIQKQGIWRGEVNNIKKDGTTFWCFANVSVLDHAEYGEVLVSVHSDITERKETEEELKNSEEKFRTLITSSPSAMYMTDENGNCIYANPPWADMTGLTMDEIKGKGWVNGIHEEDRKKVEEDWYKTVEAGGRWGTEYRLVNKNGDITWVYGTANKLKDASGKVIGYVGVNTDITERRNAEKYLKESEEKFRIIFNNTSDGILIADIEEKKFFMANDAICSLLGYTREEIIGVSVKDIHPEADLPHIVEQFERQARGEIVVAEDIPVMRKDGTVFYADIHSKPIMLSGNEYLAGVFTDITKRKKAEIDRSILAKNLESLWALTKLQEKDLNVIADFVLEEISRMSGSKYGFYGFLNKDESVMRVHSWSQEVMKDCEMHDQYFEYKIENSGIWGDAVRKRKNILINDYTENFEGKLGIPEGHVALTRVLSVPVFSKDKIVAIGTVANKDSDYTPADVKQLSSFLLNANLIIERKKAEQELKSISSIPSENPNPVVRIDKKLRIIYVNAAFNTLLKDAGFSEEDSFEILPDNIKELVDQVLKTKQPAQFIEVTVGDKIISYNIIPIAEHGYVNLYGRDVTEKVVAAEELKARTEELERINKAFVGRELKMIELKKEIEELKKNK